MSQFFESTDPITEETPQEKQKATPKKPKKAAEEQPKQPKTAESKPTKKHLYTVWIPRRRDDVKELKIRLSAETRAKLDALLADDINRNLRSSIVEAVFCIGLDQALNAKENGQLRYCYPPQEAEEISF